MRNIRYVRNLHFLIVGALLVVIGLNLTATHANATSPDVGFTLTHHGVLVSSTLPHCEQEDGSGPGPLPCSWNFEPQSSPDGNGRGLAYWIGTQRVIHYVWRHDPTNRPTPNHPQWRWLTSAQADAFAEGGYPANTPWAKCVQWHTNGYRTGGLFCPNGIKDVWSS